jgi:hypothetical protein
MERSNSWARMGGHADAVDPAERDRGSNRPSAGGFVGAQAGLFVEKQYLSADGSGRKVRPVK